MERNRLKQENQIRNPRLERSKQHRRGNVAKAREVEETVRERCGGWIQGVKFRLWAAFR
jgi:hypothetical protein